MLRSAFAQTAGNPGLNDGDDDDDDAGNDNRCVSVHAPKSPLAPQMLVQYSKQVGSCDTVVVFDAGAMQSRSGLRPLLFSWEVLSHDASGGPLPLNLTSIARNQSVLRILRSELAEEAGSVTAALTVTTFLGGSNIERYTTFINATALPDIQIQHPAIVRLQDVSEIIATATLPTCVGVSEPAFSFQWYIRAMANEEAELDTSHSDAQDNFDWVEITTGNAEGIEHTHMDMKGFYFTDKRRAKLVAKPYTWRPCLSYELRAEVEFVSRDSSPVTNFQTVVVGQRRGKVHAIIDAVDMKVTASQALTLDASSSYDEDRLTPAVRLSFLWECTIVSTGKPCRAGITGARAGILQIPANTLPARTRVRVAVTVSSDAHPVFSCYPKKPRQATDWVIITVADVPAPSVRLQVCTTRACVAPVPVIKGRAVVNYHPEQSYFLRMNTAMPASATEDEELTAQCGDTLQSHWSPKGGNTVDAVDTKSLVTQHPVPPSGVEILKFTLKQPPSSARGASYRFLLSVTGACELDGKSVPSTAKVDIDVDVNSPPQSGRLAVTHPGTTEPRAAATLFDVHHADKWVDRDFPLQYHFAFLLDDLAALPFEARGDPQGGGQPHLVYFEESARSSDSMQTMLPIPGNCPRREITVVVQVSD